MTRKSWNAYLTNRSELLNSRRLFFYWNENGRQQKDLGMLLTSAIFPPKKRWCAQTANPSSSIISVVKSALSAIKSEQVEATKHKLLLNQLGMGQQMAKTKSSDCP